MSAAPKPDYTIPKNRLDSALTVRPEGVSQAFYLTLVCPLNRTYDLVIHTGNPQDPMLRLKLADGDAKDVFTYMERLYIYDTPEVRAMTRRVVPTMNERRASILLVIERTRGGGFLITEVYEHVKSLWP